MRCELVMFNDEFLEDLWITMKNCYEKLERYTPYKCEDFLCCEDCVKVVKECLLDKDKSKPIVDWSKVERGTYIKVSVLNHTTFRFKFIFYEDGLCWCLGYSGENKKNRMVLNGYDPDLCSIAEEGE